ncbi:type II toxin-antitoxin system VapC family toxin [Methanobrevibacter sp.]|uniref:type II toxin-antitoxin system VapC family toxin n=1 Tax=Methanobrevibacter sp. TaxID=66852 RepID=UPI0025E0C9A2|nr:PIN domain-containing protein [Methanobrevibacter sp.]
MIFVDTSFLVGLLLTNDVNNPRANELIGLIDGGNLIINNTVLTETINFLSKCKKIKQGYIIKESIEIILNSCDIHYLNSNEYNDAIDLYLHYNGAINYSDCTILKSMESLGINKIVSFDSDFDSILGIKRIF